MDGYIKHQNDKIRSIRHIIWAKYSTTLLLIVFILLALLLMFTNQRPTEWTKKEIVFSHFSRERFGFTLFDSDVLNTVSGEKFSIRRDEILDGLIDGNTYQLVYSRANAIAGLAAIEAISDENTIYQDLNVSIERWNREQLEVFHTILALCITELIALLLIDRLWCKTEHARIRECQSKIARRKERSTNY